MTAPIKRPARPLRMRKMECLIPDIVNIPAFNHEIFDRKRAIACQLNPDHPRERLLLTHRDPWVGSAGISSDRPWIVDTFGRPTRGSLIVHFGSILETKGPRQLKSCSERTADVGWSQNKAWSKLVASFDMRWNSKLFETLLAFLSGHPPFQNSWCAGCLWGDSWLHDRERGHEWGSSVCPGPIPRNKSLRNPRREGHGET